MGLSAAPRAGATLGRADHPRGSGWTLGSCSPQPVSVWGREGRAAGASAAVPDQCTLCLQHTRPLRSHRVVLVARCCVPAAVSCSLLTCCCEPRHRPGCLSTAFFPCNQAKGDVTFYQDTAHAYSKPSSQAFALSIPNHSGDQQCPHAAHLDVREVRKSLSLVFSTSSSSALLLLMQVVAQVRAGGLWCRLSSMLWQVLWPVWGPL